MFTYSRGIFPRIYVKILIILLNLKFDYKLCPDPDQKKNNNETMAKSKQIQYSLEYRINEVQDENSIAEENLPNDRDSYPNIFLEALVNLSFLKVLLLDIGLSISDSITDIVQAARKVNKI